jgi:hypothetical protein
VTTPFLLLVAGGLLAAGPALITIALCHGAKRRYQPEGDPQ